MQSSAGQGKAPVLTVVIPCYNEQATIRKCVERVLAISDPDLALQVIIVDDFSTDKSLSIALQLEKKHEQVRVIRHEKNRGKGAALRTGFGEAAGDFVAVQDADLEYDPSDLKKLLEPLISGYADVVLGSRFLSTSRHRVLYFWHYVGNRILTLLSDMFTDLNLSDMECCYKVFRRDVIQSIELHEDRFGFEPEVVAKLAHRRLRIYEMGVSYHGRTYEEGKKIALKDGFRALYCIFHYNMHKTPIPVQFMVYLAIGGISGIFNLFLFLGLLRAGLSAMPSAVFAFFSAAIFNYLLCIALLFRHKARWTSLNEVFIYFVVVCIIGFLDAWMTTFLVNSGASPWISKSAATVLGLALNFAGRRYLVFPESPSGSWKPQEGEEAQVDLETLH